MALKKDKVRKVLSEFKHGTLRSGKGGKGGKVKSRKQAIAIALSEARAAGANIPPPKSMTRQEHARILRKYR